jgi:asparagine synthase (glutamine-hydrolysing)
LYHGWDKNGNYYVASELKALEGVCKTIETFLPGHLVYSKDGSELQQWYKRDWESFDAVKDNETDIEN